MADELTEALNFLSVRIDAARTTPEAFNLDGLLGEAGRALAALGEVLKLHTEAVIKDTRPPFHYCSRCSGHPKWPCPEVQAISRELLGTKGEGSTGG